MVDNPGSSLYEWTEVRIEPRAGQPKAELLLKVIDPMVHGEFAERIESWHYFWEPKLLLRIRWLQPAEAARDQEHLKAALDRAKVADQLERWEITPYTGEAAFYGEEMWDNTFHDWTAGSELALAIVKFGAQGQISKDQAFHWNRRVHLFSNELGLSWYGEGYLSLAQAYGYLDLHAKDEERRQVPASERLVTNDIVSEIERLIKQLEAKAKALMGTPGR